MNSKITSLLASLNQMLPGSLLSAAKADDLKAKYPELAADIDVIVESDPTSQKKYLVWAVGQLQDGAKAGDLADVIQQYHKALPRLSGPDKDLTSLRSLEDMKAVVSRAEQKATRGDLKQKAKKGGVILYESPDKRWLLVHPTTMDGAIYWGTNTSWCISRRDKDQNYFYYYSLDKNVQFYLLIDKKAEAYTEEFASKSHGATHFSKLAILFSDGKPHHSEPFQDAANRKPPEAKVVEAIGKDVFDTVMEIAAKHASRHKQTWSRELVTTKSAEVFRRLYNEHSAEANSLGKQVTDQVLALGDDEMRRKLIDSALKNDNPDILMELARAKGTEAHLLAEIAERTDYVPLLKVIARRDDIFSNSRLMDQLLSSKTSARPNREILWALVSNNRCPEDVFFRAVAAFDQERDPYLYQVVKYRKDSMGEREILWVIDEVMKAKAFGFNVIEELLDAAKGTITEKVADRILSLLEAAPADHREAAMFMLGKSEKAPQSTINKLLDLGFRGAVASNPSAPVEVLESLVAHEDTHVKLARNPSITPKILDALLEAAKRAPTAARRNSVLNGLTQNRRLGVEQVDRVLKFMVEELGFPLREVNELWQTLFAKNNKNPDVQKAMIDRGLSEYVVTNIMDRLLPSDAEALAYLLGRITQLAPGSAFAQDAYSAYRFMFTGGKTSALLPSETLKNLVKKENWNPALLAAEEAEVSIQQIMDSAKALLSLRGEQVGDELEARVVRAMAEVEDLLAQ